MILARYLLAVSVGFSLIQSVHAQELERTFADLQFSYKLPSKEWTWTNEKIPNAAFLAIGPKDYRVLVVTMASPGIPELNQKFVEGFESSFYVKGMKKRGGRFVNYQGRNCYQAEAQSPDGRTIITRILLAQNHGYQFMVIGGADPIENTPEFESIVNGFTLTAPPPAAAPPAATPEGTNISRLMGGVACFCAFAILIVFGIRLVFYVIRRVGGTKA